MWQTDKYKTIASVRLLFGFCSDTGGGINLPWPSTLKRCEVNWDDTGRNLSREETWFFSSMKPCCFRVHLLDIKVGLEETILIVDVERRSSWWWVRLLYLPWNYLGLDSSRQPLDLIDLYLVQKNSMCMHIPMHSPRWTSVITTEGFLRIFEG